METDNAGCLDCIYKHVAQAMIIHQEEVPNGYPQDIRRVIGHLGEASRHAMPKYKDISAIFRAHRLRVMETPEYMPPYEYLLDFVECLMLASESDLPIPNTPEECQAVKP